ncbi:VanZ family protein [Alkalibacter rhizosphaerae]|uniref:VanZ family protein n=1 Tax=Alkalibacter rhizosphaerae TaxID=2815577 RepID=A0A975AI46_9FIRM|nr:VanZ family protein [Alkalibacter rhizosphaerae]QSX08155.1 VanZ family protein [Alkalibacter rhizosphaerae]
MKKKRKKKKNNMKWWVSAYLLVLVLLTLRPFSGNVVAEKEYNLVLFQSLGNYWTHMKNHGLINLWAWEYFPEDLGVFFRNIFTVSFINLGGNILLFMPLGFFFGRFFRRQKGMRTLLTSFFVSAGIELAQFIGLSSRIADVDDVILNVVGGMFGFGLYILYDKWKKGSEGFEE